MPAHQRKCNTRVFVVPFGCAIAVRCGSVEFTYYQCPRESSHWPSYNCKVAAEKGKNTTKIASVRLLRPNPAFPLYVLSPLPAAIQSAEQEAAWNTQTKALQPKHYTVVPQALCLSAWPRHPVGVLRMMALIACSSTCRAA